MKRTQELQIERKKFTFWFAVNAGIHVFVLFSALLYQYYWGTEKKQPAIVNVSLVSLPGSGGSSSPGSGQEPGGDSERQADPSLSAELPEEPETTRRNEPDPVVPIPEISPVKKAVPEKTVQKKTAEKELPKPQLKSEPEPVARNKQEDLNKAFERLRKSVDTKSAAARQQQHQENIGNALERLNRKVASQGSRQGSGAGGGGGSGGSAASAGSGSGGGGTADPYKAKIAEIIQKNWEFSSKMLQNSYGMEVYVHITVLGDGTIHEIRYARRAPSEYLNNSVKKALDRSSPLPPLPSEYGSGGISIGFVFTPEGIDR